MLAWYLTRPIQRMRIGFGRLARGDFATRLAPAMGRRRDEIADLARDFDSMAARLQELVAARDRLQKKLQDALAKDFPNAVSRVYPLELGPPVGWPIQYRVSGPDISQVREIALKLASAVSSNPNVENVNFDWLEPARKLRIRIDQDEARLLGLSSQAVARILDTVVSGVPVTQIRDDIYLVNVVARATGDQRVSLNGLRTLQVPLPNGRTVPLSQFASFDYEQEYPLIWRRDRIPNLTVQSDLRPGVLPEEVVSANGGDRATVILAFHAHDLSVKKQEAVTSLREVKGWHWCRNGAGQEGWLPAYLLVDGGA